MIELRWHVEEWVEYRDGLRIGIANTGSPVLQYRQMDVSIDPVMLCLVETEWSDWQDVPTVKE